MSPREQTFSLYHYQENYLPMSFECPTVLNHKKILSLAVIENIPLHEARKKVAKSKHSEWTDPTFNFRDFSYLKERGDFSGDPQVASLYTPSMFRFTSGSH